MDFNSLWITTLALCTITHTSIVTKNTFNYTSNLTLWQSLSSFTPIRNASYGQIKLGRRVLMEFKFIYHSPSNEYNSSNRFYYENAIPHIHHIDFSISDNENTWRRYPRLDDNNLNITPEQIYDCIIEFNQTYVSISINNNILSFNRSAHTDYNILSNNPDMMIWISQFGHDENPSPVANVTLFDIQLQTFDHVTQPPTSTLTDSPTDSPIITSTESIKSTTAISTTTMQSVSVKMNHIIAIGDFLNVSVIVLDTELYQLFSTIDLYNDLLYINHTVKVTYDRAANIPFIVNCTVFNWNENTMCLCNQGIGPIKPVQKAYEYIIEVTSDDSNVINDGIKIIIATLSVEYNEWIAVDTENVVKSICPNDQCCQDISGCFYELETKNGYLCAENRNHSITLCGLCDIGYAEVFNSPSCQKCDNLLFPIFIAFLLVFLLILCDRNGKINANDNSQIIDKKKQLKEQNKQLMIQDESEGILVLIFRVIILFYQSINYILWQAGYTFWGTFLIQIFSFDSYLWFWFFNYSSQGTCFLTNLTAMQYLILYIACLLFALIIYALFKTICCKCNGCQFGGHTVWNVDLIALVPILIVFFMILSCKSIGHGSVHFYASDMVALVLLLMILFFFACIWIILKRIAPNSANSDRNTFWKHKSSFFKGIVEPYKFDFWYWEFCAYFT